MNYLVSNPSLKESKCLSWDAYNAKRDPLVKMFGYLRAGCMKRESGKNGKKFWVKSICLYNLQI
jgi:hypothetical protein